MYTHSYYFTIQIQNVKGIIYSIKMGPFLNIEKFLIHFLCWYQKHGVLHDWRKSQFV